MEVTGGAAMYLGTYFRNNGLNRMRRGSGGTKSMNRMQLGSMLTPRARGKSIIVRKDKGVASPGKKP